MCWRFAACLREFNVLALTYDSHCAADAAMRRDDICLYVSPANRAQLKAIIVDRKSPRKLVWRAEIVPAMADGLGTNAIMRRTGRSKPAVWRWQERYMDEGVEGLKRDVSFPFTRGRAPGSSLPHKGRAHPPCGRRTHRRPAECIACPCAKA
jgi:hypothetical protein